MSNEVIIRPAQELGQPDEYVLYDRTTKMYMKFSWWRRLGIAMPVEWTPEFGQAQRWASHSSAAEWAKVYGLTISAI